LPPGWWPTRCRWTRSAFPYPPPLHVADYELVFAPRHTFDAPRLEARFPTEWLALPVRRDEAALRPS
jgi:hypothetical protein